eukprot:scaffold41802_cov42-Phaeocystis_antarctica.AAC.3
MERYGRGTAYFLWIYLLTSLPMMAARMMARYGVEAESEPTPTMSACVSSGLVKKIGSAQVKAGSTWYTASTLRDSGRAARLAERSTDDLDRSLVGVGKLVGRSRPVSKMAWLAKPEAPWSRGLLTYPYPYP